MDALIILIPGLIAGFAALVTAFHTLFKKEASRNKENTEVSNEAVEVIEKIVDGQTTINQMMLERIKHQDHTIDSLNEKVAELTELLKAATKKS